MTKVIGFVSFVVISFLWFGSMSSGEVVILGLMVVMVVMWMTTVIRLILLAGISFGIAYAGQSSAIIFGIGMAFGVVMLCLIPAPWLGYDDLFLYRWFEASDDESDESDESGGDGGGGD